MRINSLFAQPKIENNTCETRQKKMSSYHYNIRFKYIPMRYALLLLMCCSASFVISEEKKSGGTISGYVFGDYFYKLNGTSTTSGVTFTQYSNVKKTEQAFQLRRIYVYYDYVFHENISSQLLVEGNDKTLIGGKIKYEETVDSVGEKITIDRELEEGKMSVYIKTAFLEWKELIPAGSVFLGMVPTPSWSIAEKIWNYRSIEKTILDYRGLGIGSDLGISVKGKFDSEGIFHYAVMLGNGTGQKPENNKYKKYYVSLNVKPMKEFTVEGYFDFEPNEHQKSKATRKLFGAYQTSGFTVGIEAVQQIQRKADVNGDDVKPFGIALFAWFSVPNVEQCNAFFRFDTFYPNTRRVNAGYTEHYITFGIDYMPIPNIHLMPNIWINSFTEKSSVTSKKESDIVARMTFFYVYN
jgi:hypothetical protein